MLPSGTAQWAANWIFVPGFRDGRMPYGEYTRWLRKNSIDRNRANYCVRVATGKHKTAKTKKKPKATLDYDRGFADGHAEALNKVAMSRFKADSTKCFQRDRPQIANISGKNMRVRPHVSRMLLLPAWIEECGIDIRHPGRIWIGFHGHIQPARSRARDHFQALWRASSNQVVGGSNPFGRTKINGRCFSVLCY